MEPRVSLVTVATADLDVARGFYLHGLGWPALLDVPGEVVMVQVGHGLLLSLYDVAHLARDLGRDPGPPGGFTLAHNVGSEAEVDGVVARMTAAGAHVLTAPARATWGGYTAHLVDPVGVVWEVAHNPGWRVAEDGSVSLSG